MSLKLDRVHLSASPGLERLHAPSARCLHAKAELRTLKTGLLAPRACPRPEPRAALRLNFPAGSRLALAGTIQFAASLQLARAALAEDFPALAVPQAKPLSPGARLERPVHQRRPCTARRGTGCCLRMFACHVCMRTCAAHASTVAPR